MANNPIFEWFRHRDHGNQNILLLKKDGKKIGGTKEVWFPKECTCGACAIWQCERCCPGTKYEGFVGGGKIGTYPTQTEAKIAVETALGVSTKKQKNVQPELSYHKGANPVPVHPGRFWEHNLNRRDELKRKKEIRRGKN